MIKLKIIGWKRIFRPPFLEKGNRTLLSTIFSESPDQGLSYMGISGCSEEASKDFRYFIYEGKLLSGRRGQKYRPVLDSCYDHL